MARVHDHLVCVHGRLMPVDKAREEAGRILDACDLAERGARPPRQPEPFEGNTDVTDQDEQ